MNGGPKGAPTQFPKYLNDFTKALASEVRVLLEEVGKLRDERRALQYEIAELMNLKSKHGAGGEYAPDWHPRIEAPPLPEAPPPPLAIEDASPVHARPGWRVVHKRPERKPRMIKGAPAPSPASPPPPLVPAEPPRPELPAWQNWRPNPLLAPTPVLSTTSGSPVPTSPGGAGLFGPPTPPPK